MMQSNIDFVPDQVSPSAGAPSIQSSNNSSGIDFVPDAPSPSLASRIGGDIGSGFSFLGKVGVNQVLGAGDALRNTLASAANIIPGSNIPMAQSGQGAAYGVGKFAGNIGGFLAGGEALDAARAGAEALPYVGQAAQYLGGSGLLPGMARRAIGSGAYAAAATPDNRLQQGATGAATSAALDTIPVAGSALAPYGKQLAGYFQPNQYAQNIIQGLSPKNVLEGSTKLQTATKSVLSDIQNAYQSQKTNATNMYNNVFDQVPQGSIYQTSNALIKPEPSILTNVHQNYTQTPIPNNLNYGNNLSVANDVDRTSYMGDSTPIGPAALMPGTTAANDTLPPSYLGGQTTAQQNFSNLSGMYPSIGQKAADNGNYTNDLMDAHNAFVNNPTFANAHSLQSQLGARIRQIETSPGPTDIPSANEMSALQSARSALIGRDSQGNITGDIGNFLNQNSPEVAQQYKAASDNYLQNVVPYMNNKKIFPIADGQITNVQPSSLGNIFKAPDENMQKIMSDLPSSTFDNMLYTKLGQTVPSKSAQGLVNSFNNLDQQGLGSYISPDLSQNINTLKSKIEARSSLQNAIGMTAGVLGGSHFGPLGSVVGALVGKGAAAISNPFLNYFTNRMPNSNLGGAAANLMGNVYSPLRTAILANHFNNSSNGGQ